MKRISYRPPNALIQLVVDRAGIGTETYRLIVFIHEWAMAEAERGERIGIEWFAAWSPGSNRTAYRRLAEFRQAFPELGDTGTPSDMIVWREGLPARDRVESIRWELSPA